MKKILFLDSLLLVLWLIIMFAAAIDISTDQIMNLLMIFFLLFAYFEYKFYGTMKELEEEVYMLKKELNERKLKEKFIEIFGVSEEEMHESYKEKFNITENELSQMYDEYNEYRTLLERTLEIRRI